MDGRRHLSLKKLARKLLKIKSSVQAGKSACKGNPRARIATEGQNTANLIT
jgi:hypothetical protein